MVSQHNAVRLSPHLISHEFRVLVSHLYLIRIQNCDLLLARGVNSLGLRTNQVLG
jgi:hypothetical protein